MQAPRVRRLGFTALMTALSLCACVGAPPPLTDYPDGFAHTVKIDGIDIHYLDFNPQATGPTLVWVHGQSGAALEAYYLVDHLSRDYRLVALDLPGAGYSEKPRVRYSAELYTSVLSGFINTLGLERFVLVGHSLGAVTATKVAADAPEGLEALILVAPYLYSGQPGGVLELLSNTGFLVNIAMGLYAPWMLRTIVRSNAFHDPQKLPDDLLATYLRAVFHTPNGRGSLASVTRRIVGHPPEADLLRSITLPTLVLWGSEDKVLPNRRADRLAEHIPQSRQVTFEKTGHVPHVERPEATAREIERFLSTRW